MAGPVQLKHRETGELVTVETDDLGDAVRSGQYLVPKGTEVPVLDTDGTVKALPVELVSNGTAETAGIRVAGRGDIDEWRKQQQYGEGVGNAVRATAEAFTNEALLGAGDAVTIGLGISSAEGIAERRARNETAAAIGTAGGIVLPVVATMGGSAVAQAGGRGVLGATSAALRMTPTAIIARGGAAAQTALTKQMGGTFAARLAAASTVSAAEGAIFGTGQALSSYARDGESVLGDHETVAEYMLASAGQGALIGAAAGAFGETLVSGAVAGVDNVAQRFRRTSALAPDAASDDVRAAILADAKEMGIPRKSVAKSLVEITDNAKASRELPDEIARVTEAGTAKGDELQYLKEQLFDRMQISGKLDGVKKALRGSPDVGDGGAVAIDAFNRVEKLAETLEYAMKDTGSQNAAEARRLLDGGRDGGSVRKTLRKLARAVSEAGGDIPENVRRYLPKQKPDVYGMGTAARKIDREDLHYRVFADLDSLKRSIGKLREKVGGREDLGTDEIAASFRGELRLAYDDLAQHLENPALYGKRVASIQVGDNRAWVPWFDVNGGYSQEFLRRGDYGVKGGYKAALEAGDYRAARNPNQMDAPTRFDPEKFGSFLRSSLDEGKALKRQALVDHLDTEVALFEQLAKSHNATAETRAMLAQYKRVAGELVDDVAHVEKLSQKAQAWESLGRDAEGTPISPVLRFGKSVLAAAERMNVTTGLAETAARIEGKVSAAITGLSTRIGNTAPRGRRAIVPSIEAARAGVSRRDYYAKKRDEVRRLQASPEMLAARTTGLVDPTHAPTVSTHATTKSAAAVAFLERKAPSERPKHPLRPDLDKEEAVDPIEARKWLRYVRAVEDPIGALDRMAKGDVMKEDVEAIREVYPKLYQRVIEGLFDRVGDLEKLPSMSDAIQLSLIFGVPMHFTTRPEFIRSYQAVYSPEQGEQASGQRTPPSARPTTSKLAGNMATTAQRLEQM